MQMRIYIDIIFFPVSSPIHAVSRLNISYSQILFVLDSNRSSSGNLDRFSDLRSDPRISQRQGEASLRRTPFTRVAVIARQ